MSDDNQGGPHSGRLVAADNAMFRKGMIFGLTLAEVILLLVFMLLLALGALLKTAQARIDHLAQQASREVAAEARLSTVLHELSPTAPPQQVEKWVRELVESRMAEQDVNRLRDRFKRATEAVTRLDSAATASGLIPPQKPPPPGADADTAADQRLSAAASNFEKTMTELRGLRAANSTLQNSSQGKLAGELTQAKLEGERLKGSAAYAERRLADLGHGMERPACWATAEGKPEYIFEVGLSEQGISINDRALPQRRAQEAQLPISSIQFERPLSNAEFRQQTQPIFDWGEAHDCRFFVIAVDRTGPAQKELFKQRLRVMEDHFYKYLQN